MSRNWTLKEANRAKYKGAVLASELTKEIQPFLQRWNFYQNNYGSVLGVPNETLRHIFSNPNSLVKKATVDAIRSGIRNYDPRTCRYRRLSREEVEKALRRMKERHGLTNPQLAEALGTSTSKISNLISAKSGVFFVEIEVMRDMLINYNKWIVERSVMA